MINQEIKDKAVELLGSAQPVTKPTKKENVLSFRKGHVYIALKLVTPYDKEKQQYAEPMPKIVFLVDGKYVRMPIDSSLLKSLGKFLIDLGEVVEGVDVPEMNIDVESAKKMLSSCSEKVSI